MNKLSNLENANIAIIGLGYVGLPLAIEFSKKFQTIGFDKNKERIKQLADCYDITMEISSDELKSTNLAFTSNSADIIDCNIYIIAVPTPIDNYNNPNMTALASASAAIGKMLKKNDLVIYESTVYPGATEEFCVPILEKRSGLIFNRDFFCGYSPERINPGDSKHTLQSVVKVTSGSNEKIANDVNQLYQSIVPIGTYKASSIRIAEAAKVIENIQRDVNIALINELSMLFNKLNLDTNEILEAAKTKWNFIPFRPGLVGGHCIGVDPYYLTHKAKDVNYHPEIILAGRRINDSMGKYIAESTIVEMVKYGINPKNAEIAILGITFKENCPDLRNTKVPDIINYLINYGCNVKIADPYADTNETLNKYNLEIVEEKNIKCTDVIIVAVAHDEYKKISANEWAKKFNNNALLIDVKGVINKNSINKENIKYWSL